MLIEFKVANYRSFREEQTLSLVASNSDKKELPGNKIERKLPGMSGLSYLKSAALYGPNASGKSNLLRAFAELASFVEKSAYKLGPNSPTFAAPFKLEADFLTQPSRFEVVFVAENVRYLFSLALTKERVIEETLVAYPKGLPQQWYTRTWNESTNQYSWKFASSTYFKKDQELVKKTRPNATFLSTAVQYAHPQLKPVYDWFAENMEMLEFGGRSFIMPIHTGKMMLESSETHSIVEQMLRNADIGITSARVEEEPIPFSQLPLSWLKELDEKEYESNPKYKKMQITLSHSGKDGNLVDMDFDREESEGTRQYFSLLGPWLDILNKGGVLIVDEIETNLHPILVWELIKLFNSEEHNPNGAQLIFSTHIPYLLDLTLFRRDQFWFTEKNQEGATQLYPLPDCKPRKDESLTRGYLAGRYGAVPYIPEGLLK